MDFKLDKLNMQNFTHRRIAEIIRKCEKGEEITPKEGRFLRWEVFR